MDDEEQGQEGEEIEVDDGGHAHSTSIDKL